MFIFEHLTERQIQIPLLEFKVNNFFQGLTGVLSGRNYSELWDKSKRNLSTLS